MMTSTSGCCGLHAAEQVHPAHARHQHVDEHHVDRARLEERERRLPVFGGHHLEADAHEHARQAAPNVGSSSTKSTRVGVALSGCPRGVGSGAMVARGRMVGVRGGWTK